MILPLLSLNTGIEFSWYSKFLQPESSFRTDTGMLLFVQEQIYNISASVEFRWETLEWFSLLVSWEGQFLDSNILLPQHIFGLSLEARTLNRRWSAILEGKLSVYTLPEIPELNVGIAFAPTTGVEFSLRGTDLLSPLLPENRKIWGFYETPGLGVIFLTSISL
jgi:hypothetical protein